MKGFGVKGRGGSKADGAAKPSGVTAARSLPATAAGPSGQQRRDRLRRIRRVARGEALVEPRALDEARDRIGEVGERDAVAQRELEAVERLGEHPLDAAPPRAGTRPGSAADLLAPQPVRHRGSATATRATRSRPPARRRGADRARPPRRRTRRPTRRRSRSRPAPDSGCSICCSALSASAMVSARNAAWLPNRLVIAPRVLPSSAATAFASSRAIGPDGDRAIVEPLGVGAGSA